MAMNPFAAFVLAKVLTSLRDRRRRAGGVRVPVPATVRRDVLSRPCAWPLCRARSEHVHHRLPVEHRGTNARSNLTGLCARHHRWAHGGGRRQAYRNGVLVTRRRGRF